MSTRQNGVAGAWIRQFHRATDSCVRLVCFPHAGGSASFYHPFSAALSASVEVLAVQYPGRQDRHAEPSVTNLSDLADQVWEALRQSAGEPMALFGHSMGAILAFEVGLRMRRDGLEPPVRLFASGRRAPSRHRDERVHRLDDAGILAEMRLLGGPNATLLADREFVEMVLPAVRADYQAVETYQYQHEPPLDCPVTVLVGERDPRVTIAEARAWTEHTTEPTDLHVFPGGHFFLVEHSTQVIDLVAAYLGAAKPRAGITDQPGRPSPQRIPERMQSVQFDE